MRLSFDDFCRCTPEEFNETCKAYQHQRESDYKDGWEQTRTLATISVQPYAKRRLTAHSLLPFPWDDRRDRDEKKEIVSAEEGKKRFEEIIKRV